MAANELFDTGIKVTGSFSAAGAFPVDGKCVVGTIEERDDHVAQNRAYDGMEVYVRDVRKKYRYVNKSWIEVKDSTPETLIAQYNETTWKEIDDAMMAYVPIVVEAFSIDGTDTAIRARLTRYSGTTYIFTAVDIDGIHQFTCHYANGWSHAFKSLVLPSNVSELLLDSDGNALVDNNDVTLVSE